MLPVSMAMARALIPNQAFLAPHSTLRACTFAANRVQHHTQRKNLPLEQRRTRDFHRRKSAGSLGRLEGHGPMLHQRTSAPNQDNDSSPAPPSLVGTDDNYSPALPPRFAAGFSLPPARCLRVGRNKTAASMLEVLDTTAPGRSIATGFFLFDRNLRVSVKTDLQWPLRIRWLNLAKPQHPARGLFVFLHGSLMELANSKNLAEGDCGLWGDPFRPKPPGPFNHLKDHR
jgi:hypothetical protein